MDKIRREVHLTKEELDDMQILADNDDRSLKSWMERALRQAVLQVKSINSRNKVLTKRK